MVHRIELFSRHVTRPALRALLVFAGAVTLFSIAACERGPQGIFYSIATAQEIVEGNLPKGAIVNGMVEAIDVNATNLDYYFAAVGGRVWYRRADGDEADWSRLTNPSGYRTNHSRPTSIVNLDGTIYVSFVEGERERSGVYELNPADRTFTPPIPGSFSDGVRIVSRLFALPGTGGTHHLFASIQHRDDGETAEYELWYLGDSDGTVEIELNSVRNLSSSKLDGPFISATSDGAGNFWFITTERAYQIVEAALTANPDPANLDTLTLSSEDRLATLGGIFFHGGTLYLSSRSGDAVEGGSQGRIVESTTAGADWNVFLERSDRAFTDFAFANLPDTDDTLLVGTYRTLSGIRVVSSGGLFEISLTDPAPAKRRSPLGSSYLASDLSNSAVMQIFVPQNLSDQDGTVFALTGGNGLWRGVYGTDGEARWIWE